jgi:predicted nucleotide-binding protein
MESSLDQLEQLLKTGSSFTFDNFSIRARDNPYIQYGGEDTPDWLAWKTRVCNTVERLLDPKSAPYILVRNAIGIVTQGNGEDKFTLQKSQMLRAIEQTIEILRNDVYGETKAPKSLSRSSVYSNRVFIVHGHDHFVKTELENFLTGIGLEPVVLHRQPDQGRTLIEKFEQHSDVGFAFIILTPDDVAYSAEQESQADSTRKKEFRARPNVIFEFGYFVGKLGRHRVCCLIKGDLSRPSDIDGLVYKPLDGSLERIGYALIKELKAAGYTMKI